MLLQTEVVSANQQPSFVGEIKKGFFQLFTQGVNGVRGQQISLWRHKNGEKCDWSRSRGYCRPIGKNSKGLVFSVVGMSICTVAADFLFTANPAVIFFPASLHPDGTPLVCCRTACKHIPVLVGSCNHSELHVDYKEKCCEGKLKMKVPDMMGTVLQIHVVWCKPEMKLWVKVVSYCFNLQMSKSTTFAFKAESLIFPPVSQFQDCLANSLQTSLYLPFKQQVTAEAKAMPRWFWIQDCSPHIHFSYWQQPPATSHQLVTEYRRWPVGHWLVSRLALLGL